MTEAGRTLLVVEDDPEIAYLLSVVLAGEEREVITVGAGAAARTLVAEKEVDLILLDLILPDVDGRTLLAELRRRPETAAVPIVVISARGETEVRQECFDLGADAFVEKPFDPDELASSVSARLQRVDRSRRGSLRDALTGLLNHAGLALAAEESSDARSLALIQLDGFSMIAERWGWAEAEAALRRVGDGIVSGLPPRTEAARLGGGEFALLMHARALGEAVEACERLLERIQALEVRDPDGEALRLSASIGVVVVDGRTPLEEGLEVARRRLFQARAHGGGHVAWKDDDAESASPGRVLVAEDDEISATILLHRLRKEGLEVVRFDNGKEALEAALEQPPDLVILDVKMPGMDGFEVLDGLRRTPAFAAIPVILLTSMGSEADVVRGFQSGADDYILKPFSPVELSARVWRLLRRGRSGLAV